MNQTETYNYLGEILSFLLSDEYESSIRHMAKDTHLPVSYVRNTLIAILKNRFLSGCLYLPDDEDANDPDLADSDDENANDPALTDSDDEDANDPALADPDDEDANHPDLADPDHKETLIKAIESGFCDDRIFKIALTDSIDGSGLMMLSLTSLEYSALTSLGDASLPGRESGLFEKKDHIQAITPQIRKNLTTLSEAKTYKNQVTFMYRGARRTHTRVKCFPVDIVTNVSDNWIYLRAASGEVYRLDRIEGDCKKVKQPDPFPEYKEDPKRKYVWGASYKQGEQPTHVKLRIAGETKNIIRKIRNDIRFRQQTGHLYKEGNYYFYEDDIIGLADFRRWLRGYGSSIVVLSPAYLREHIVSRAEEMLWLYAHVKDWENL